MIHAGTAPTTVAADPSGVTLPIGLEAGGGCTMVARRGVGAARWAMLFVAALLLARRASWTTYGAVPSSINWFSIVRKSCESDPA